MSKKTFLTLQGHPEIQYQLRGITGATVTFVGYQVTAVCPNNADLIECSEFAIPALSDHK